MKVKNIDTHTLKHMWLAYVGKLLLENPDYRRKDRGTDADYNDVIIRKNIRDKWVQVIDYTQFKKIVEQLFNNAKTAMIKGEAFNLPHCGKIYVMRIQRDFRSKKRPVDWGKTMQRNTEFDENGKRIYKKLYYFNADDYLRVAWIKSKIPNQTWYEFVPACGDRHRMAGFKLELGLANKKDPLLKYQYLFAPLKDIVKQIV